ncbi:hypothetical protein M1B34_14635 [Pseudomonas sp. MAFF 302030]|uniref:Uncharacterized protein n=2 Tax=Pseudomonas morbosilactucae TaxID=2938197 RepID=A0A9X1YXL2_9PSED|nr:hypothetical protein [Pseudomonas morbosilactucae]MCK9798917.1 hypothetical protein [Pseudomonas morbosilactucae]
MKNECGALNVTSTGAWYVLLQDQEALLRNPGAHHKALLTTANELHRAQVIDRDGLSDLLEQADGALAFAVEELLDSRCGE